MDEESSGQLVRGIGEGSVRNSRREGGKEGGREGGKEGGKEGIEGEWDRK